MADVTTRAVLEAARDEHHEEALRLAGLLLDHHSDCPYLLVFRSILIRLQDSTTGPSLEDAERDLLRAVGVDKSYLPALEELAHYYDAIQPDTEKARFYAAKYVEIAGKVIADMREILEEQAEDNRN